MVCSTGPRNLVFSLECLVSNGRRALLGGIRLGGSATTAYCFYCYLFKPQQAGFHSNDTFTKVGFRNQKNTKDYFKEHAQSIDGFYSNARKRALDFKNQRQSVEHVWTVTSAAEEEAYKACLTIMLGIARFLLCKLQHSVDMMSLKHYGDDEPQKTLWRCLSGIERRILRLHL